MDAMLGETLVPARVDYEAARRGWGAWLDAHPLPANADLDARLRDPATRAGFVPVCRARGLYHLPTAEFVAALAATLRRLPGPHIEIGAGRGVLARAVQAAGTPLIATDDGAWWPDALPDDVERLDLAAALAHHRPGTALAVWPPRGANWPAAFRVAPSVGAYLLVGDGPGGMTGDAAAWAAGALRAGTGWHTASLPRLASLGRCRLDEGGATHTRVLLARRKGAY